MSKGSNTSLLYPIVRFFAGFQKTSKSCDGCRTPCSEDRQQNLAGTNTSPGASSLAPATHTKCFCKAMVACCGLRAAEALSKSASFCHRFHSERVIRAE